MASPVPEQSAETVAKGVEAGPVGPIAADTVKEDDKKTAACRVVGDRDGVRRVLHAQHKGS